jgi:hypothetical protein
MRTHKIAALGGDGIGPEVVEAGLEVLAACAERDGGFALDVERFDWGSDYYRKHGVMMPADGADRLRGFDAILFGAVGSPGIPDHITLWGLRLAICQPLDQYANVRPTHILPGITSPLRHVSGPELDWVIVRENSEGEYAGVGGRVHQGMAIETATDVSMMTRAGVARIMRFAFGLARSRPRKLLTVVTKSNVQRHAMVMWDEIAAEVAKEFPDVTWDKMLVDAMTMRMVMKPQSRRHPLRPGGGARRLDRHRAHRQPQPRAHRALDVRADPRFGLRHRRQGHRQPDQHVLDLRDDARTYRRKAGRRAADARGRAGHRRQGIAHTRSRRQRDDGAGHCRRLRRAAPGKRLGPVALTSFRHPRACPGDDE